MATNSKPAPKKRSLRLPPLRPGTYGNFILRKERWQDCPETYRGGYHNGGVNYEYAWVLQDSRRANNPDGAPRWVLNNPLEIEMAELALLGDWGGTVLVLGLASWPFLYHLLDREKVKRVIVLEPDADQIASFQQASGYQRWTNRDKLTLMLSGWLNELFQTKIDQVYYAGSGNLQDPQFKQVSLIAQYYKPKWMYYWGQEVDFAFYCASTKVMASLHSWRDFQKFLGVSLHPTHLTNFLPLIPKILKRFAEAAPNIDPTLEGKPDESSPSDTDNTPS